MRTPLFMLPCLLASVAAAAPLSPVARAEIDALVSRLETSGCEINRNGTWYPAAEVRSHLLTKLGYLEERGAVQSAEEFIDRAASRSSMSGRPYLIRCGDQRPTETGTWLAQQLQAMRASAPAATPP